MHHHVGHRPDDADEQAGQGVKREQPIRMRLQVVVEHPGAEQQQQATGDKHSACTESVGQNARANAAKCQEHNGQAIGLQGNGRAEAINGLQYGRCHQDDHDDPGRQQPGQQHRQHDCPAMIAQHRTQGDFFGQCLALLQFGEYRGFVQPAAQVHRQQTENTTQQERNPPGIGSHFVGREQAVDQRGHQ
ncbi:hypothetical protein D9M73_163000 [compost metagenome]